MRGEYINVTVTIFYGAELPPRARRIPDADLKHLGMLGTTSACAENTLGIPQVDSRLRNYLRVRGEYLCILVG